MSFIGRTVSIMLLAVAMPAVVATAAFAEPTVRVVDVDVSGYPRIDMTVDVGPSMLPATRISVFEDGVEVASEARRLTAGHEIVLLFDVSGSMWGEPIEALQQAAAAFVASLPSDLSVAVIAFATEVQPIVELTNNRPDVVDGIASLEADGRTALFDAVVASIDAFSPDAEQRTLVVFADGEDNHSSATLQQAQAALQAARVRAITVELLTDVSDGNTLRSLASVSGGTALEAGGSDELVDRYLEAARLVISRHAVTYLAEAATAGSVVVAVSAGSTVEYAPAVVVSYPSQPSPSTPDSVVSERTVPAAGRADVAIGEAPALLTFIVGVTTVAVALILLAVALAPAPARLGAGRRTSIGVRSRGGLADRAAHIADDGLILGRWADRVGAALERSGVGQPPGRFVVNVLAVSLAASILLGALVASAVGILAAAIMPWLAKLWLDIKADRRRKAFADQLDDTLQLLAASLRAGHSLLQSVDTVSRDAADPTASEFRRIISATRVGQDLDAALAAAVARTGSEDFSWVAQAIMIHREVGGNLAEVLDSVGGTIRERNQIRRQVQALSAEGKLSAIVLMGLPVGILLFLGVVNPAYLARFTGEPTGWAMLAAAAMLMTCGGLWLRKLIRIDF